jgi:hypothetical protein
LVGYTVQDAVNQEPLMVYAYNECLVRLMAVAPFAMKYRLAWPVAFGNPFQSDLDVVLRAYRETRIHVHFPDPRRGNPSPNH